jgi:hypothetical protein
MTQKGDSELAEHLRTVHFTLIVACVSLLLSGFLELSETLRQSLEDIKSINAALDRWDPKWLNEYADRAVKSFEEPYPYFEDLVPSKMAMSGAFKGNYNVTLPTNSWFVPPIVAPPGSIPSPSPAPPSADNYRMLSELWAKQLAHTSDAPLPPRPTTLAAFKVYWDELSETKVVLIPNRLAPFLFATSEGWAEAERVSWEKPSVGQAVWDVSFDEFSCDFMVRGILKEKLPADYQRYPCAYRGEVKEPPPGTARGNWRDSTRASMTKNMGLVLLPVEQLGRVPVDFQKGLIEHAQAKGLAVNWRTGQFKESFRDLDQLTQNYQDISFTNIEKILESEAARSGERLEVLGIKLPVDALRTWGVVIVLAIQLYFFLHIREFGKRLSIDNEAWGVAWVALYPGILESLVFLLSALLLPIVLVGIFGWECLKSAMEPHVRISCFSFYPIALILTALIAYLTGRAAWRIRSLRG